MDRMGRLGGSAEVADDGFHESMARLSVHLATRRPTHALPDPLPPRRPFRIAWPYVLLVAIVGAGAVGYPYYKWLMQDDAPRTAVQRVATAEPAPVLAAVAVAPEPAAPAPPASTPPKAEVASPVDVLAAIPEPPPPAPPVSLPAPANAAAPQPEVALNRAEIVEVQKRLAALGINPGPIDGIIGPRTAAGAAKYETRVGHAVSDKVDRGLLALLRQDPGASSALQARAP